MAVIPAGHVILALTGLPVPFKLVPMGVRVDLVPLVHHMIVVVFQREYGAVGGGTTVAVEHCGVIVQLVMTVLMLVLTLMETTAIVYLVVVVVAPQIVLGKSVVVTVATGNVPLMDFLHHATRIRVFVARDYAP